MASPSDIREAVRECLTDCLSVDLPLSALASYISYLRAEGWSPEDIHRVELVVVKVLSRLVREAEEMAKELSTLHLADQES